MQKPKPFFGKSFFRMVFTESGPLIALTVAVALLIAIGGPASAQFFNFGGPPQRQQPGSWGFGGGLAVHPAAKSSGICLTLTPGGA